MSTPDQHAPHAFSAAFGELDAPLAGEPGDQHQAATAQPALCGGGDAGFARTVVIDADDQSGAGQLQIDGHLCA